MKVPKCCMVATTVVLVSVSAVSASAATGYTQTNLVSDLPGSRDHGSD